MTKLTDRIDSARITVGLNSRIELTFEHGDDDCAVSMILLDRNQASNLMGLLEAYLKVAPNAFIPSMFTPPDSVGTRTIYDIAKATDAVAGTPIGDTKPMPKPGAGQEVSMAPHGAGHQTTDRHRP